MQVRSLSREDPLEKGNGNPLQHSCLANPMDRGAWRATVHGLQTVGQDWVTEHACCLSQHLVGMKVRRAYMFPLRCVVWSPGVKLYHVEKGIQEGCGWGWFTSANLGMDCLTWHPVDFTKASRVSLLPETDWWDGWRDGFPVWAPPAGQ